MTTGTYCAFCVLRQLIVCLVMKCWQISHGARLGCRHAVDPHVGINISGDISWPFFNEMNVDEKLTWIRT
jgi:hypothetical protein